MSVVKMDDNFTLYDKHRSVEIRQKIPLAHLSGNSIVGTLSPHKQLSISVSYTYSNKPS